MNIVAFASGVKCLICGVNSLFDMLIFCSTHFFIMKHPFFCFTLVSKIGGLRLFKQICIKTVFFYLLDFVGFFSLTQNYKLFHYEGT